MSAPTKTNVPNVSRLSYRDLQAQALVRILGCERADFSRIDLGYAQQWVDFLAAHTHRFGIPCRYLAPLSWPEWQKAVVGGGQDNISGRVMLTYTIGIGYNPAVIGPGMIAKLANTYRSIAVARTGDPNNSVRYLMRHEAGHGLMIWHTERTRARIVRVQSMVTEFWNRVGPAKIAQTFGPYAATVIKDTRGRPLPATELLPEMFGIYDLAPNRFPREHLAWIREAVETLEGKRGL